MLLTEEDKGTSSKNRSSLRDRKRKSEDIIAPTTPVTPTESKKSSVAAKRSKSEDKLDTPKGSPSQNSRDSRDRDKAVFDQNLNRTNLSPQVLVKPVRTPHNSRYSVRENQVQQQLKDNNSKASEDNQATSSPSSRTSSPRLTKSLRNTKAATSASTPSSTETSKVPKPPVPSPGNSRPGTPSRGKSPSRSTERQSPRTTRANVFESRKAPEASVTKAAASRTPRNSPSRNPAALKETPSARPSTRDSVKNQETSGGKSPRSYSESPSSRSPRTTRRSDDPSPVLRNKARQKPTTPKQEPETKTPTITKPKCDTNSKSSTSSNNNTSSGGKATTPTSRTKTKVTSGNLKAEPAKDKPKDNPEKEEDSVDTKDIVPVENKAELVAQSSKVSDKPESESEKVQPVKNQAEPPTKDEPKVAETKLAAVAPEPKVEASVVKPEVADKKDALQVQNAKKESIPAAAETAGPAGIPAGRVAVSRPSAVPAAPQSPPVRPAVSTPVVPSAPAARSSSAPAVPAHPAVTAPRPVVPEITAVRPAPAVPIVPAPSVSAGPLNLTTHSPKARPSHKTSLLPPPKRAGEMHFKKMHLLNDPSHKGQSSTEGSKAQDPYSSSGIDVSHSITDQIAKHSKERDKLNWNNNDVHASTAPHLEPHSGSYNGDSSTPHGAGESVRSSTSTSNNGDVSRERDPRYHLPHSGSGELHPHASHSTDSHTLGRPSSHHHSPSMTLPSHGLPESSRHLPDSRPKDLSLGSAAGSDYERSQSRSSDDRAASRSSADEKRPSSSSSSLSNPRLDDYRRKEMEAHGNSPLVFDKNKPVEVYRDPELLKRDQLRYLQQSQQAQALRASSHTPIPPASSYPPHAAVSSPAHAAALAQHARTLPMAAAYGSSALGALSGLSPHLGLSHSALVAGQLEHSAALRSLTSAQQAALLQQQYAALGLSQHLSSYMHPTLQTQQLEVLWQQKYPTLPVPPAWMLNQYQDELLRDVNMLRDRDMAIERERRERELLRERAERERAEREREVREREER